MFTLLYAWAALLPAAPSTPPTPTPAPFVVQGYLPATTAPKAYLQYHRGTALVVDSAVITHGRFQLHGTVDHAQQAQVLLPPAGTSYTHMVEQDVATIYLEPGTIRVTGAGLPMQATVTGTPLNQENTALMAQTAPLEAQLLAAREAWGRRPAAERADTALQHQADAQQAQLAQRLQAVYAAYLQAHPTHPFSLFALANYEGAYPDAASYAALFQLLAPGLRASPQGQQMQQQIGRLQRTAIGAQAPDFSLPDPNGKLVKLSDLRGQYVLVDFWASWCRPCRAENPTIAKAYAAYRDKHFTVVSISLDSPTARAAWLKAIHDDGMSWPQVSELRGFHTDVAQQYAISAIPQNFLLDPQGHIVAKNLRGDALAQQLAQLLSPTTPTEVGAR